VLQETTLTGHVKFYAVVFSANAKNYCSNQASSNWEVAIEKYHHTLQCTMITSTTRAAVGIKSGRD